MQFDSVSICNLFSYRDEQVFDLKAPEPGRNIVLISGRNGYGKTSFINSVKLLFGGINESMLRVIRDAKLSPKQYVLGTGDQWMGIMNRQAYSAGQRDCWVEVQWREDAGNVTARRTWHLESGSFSATLEVRSSFGGIVSEETAQSFLDERLPQDYIPFFFFDGEQIQAIAEANWSAQTKQMERILNISPIESLRDHLSKVIGEWRRNDMDLSAKHNLTRLEKEKAELLAREASSIQEQEEIQDSITELERKIEEEDRYLESMRAYSYDRDAESLRHQQNQLRSDLEEQQNTLADTLPVDIPLVSCTNLLERTIRELRELVESQSGVQVRLLEGFITGLPVDLFDKPPYPNPPLAESQKRFYKNRLTKLLQAYIPDPEHIGDSVIRIEVKRAKLLLSTLDPYMQSTMQRSQYVKDLRSITRMKRELRDVERRLDDVSNLSGVEQTTYRQRKAANDERRGLVGRHEQRLEDLRKEAQKVKNQIRDKEREIKEQEKKVVLSAKAERKIDMARRVSELFSRYKERLRSQYRGDIEESINKHFRQLMSAHGMIDHIDVLDTFGLSYVDKNGETIGMANLSAGMKQLVATSLLWTLKEVSQKMIPLVVDTPLARIDWDHQEKLIKYYYPSAGEQVIVLPTDSELDREKYSMLLPHIYRQYRLENPDGESTRPRLTEMYS